MTRFRRTFLAAFAALAVGGAGWAHAESADGAFAPVVGQAGKDVIWVPTSQALVDRMLDMAALSPADYLVDLGSGDGRTVITAAKRGARAHGIEYNPDMVALSKRAAMEASVTGRATFAQGDIFESDFSSATVVSLFLLPELNLRLRPTLLAMKPGTRVVSNSFDMREWQPDETVQVSEGCNGFCYGYKWIVPAQVEGRWLLDGKELALTQSFQMLQGTLREGADALPLHDARMVGSEIRFTAGGVAYVGQVSDGVMTGTGKDARAWRATRQP